MVVVRAKPARALVALLLAALLALARAAPTTKEVPAELRGPAPAVRALATEGAGGTANTRTVVEGAVLVDPHTAETKGLDRVDVVQPRDDTGAACPQAGCPDDADVVEGGGSSSGGAPSDQVPPSDSESDEVSFQSGGGKAPVDPSDLPLSSGEAVDGTLKDAALKAGAAKGDDRAQATPEAKAAKAKAAKAKRDADRKAGERDQSAKADRADKEERAREDEANAAEAKAVAKGKNQAAAAAAAAARRAEEAGRGAKAAEKKPDPKPEIESEALPLVGGKTTPYNSGYGKPTASVLDGLCALTGLARVSPGGWNKDVARVPVACAPKEGRRIFDARSSSGSTLRANLDARGQVSMMGPAATWLSFNGMVFPSATAKPQPLAPGPAWKAYGQGFAAPSYSLERGVCTLSGVLRLKDAKKWDAVLTSALPAACRPSARVILSANQQTNTHRVDVLPNGQVRWVGGRRTMDWLSLDGLAFGAGAAGQHALKLAAGKSAFANGYRAPSSRRVDSLCFLSGLVRGPLAAGPRAQVAVLPTDCRPAAREVFFLQAGNGARVRVDATPDGRLFWVSGSTNSGWLSLDGAVLAARSFTVTDERKALLDSQKPDAGKPGKERSAASDAAKAASAGLAPVRNLMKLFAGFRPFGHGMEPPSAENYAGGVCLAQGQLGGGRPAAVAGQLPTECDPATGRLTAPGLFNGETVEVDVRSGSRATFQFMADPKTKEARSATLPGALYPGKGAATKPVPLQHPWVPEKGYAPPTYSLGPTGLCVLSGRARRHSVRPSHVARLPEECRPARRLSFVAVQGGRAGQRVDVHPNGYVQWMHTGGRPSQPWISLTGVAFTVAKAKAGLVPLADLPAGASSGPDGFQPAAFARHGKLCVLAGAVKLGAPAKAGAALARLPSSCWPAFRTAVLVRTDKGAVRADVTPTGLVAAVSGPAGWTRAHLDGAVLIPAAAGEHLKAANVAAGERAQTETARLRLVNGWKAYGSEASLRGAYAAPDLTEAGGLCLLHGVARGGDWKRESVAALKGAACRPRGGSLVFNLHGDESVTWRVDVDGSGAVAWKADADTAGDWLSLAGAAWSRSPASPWTTASTWKDYGKGYRGSTYSVVDGVCLVGGLLVSHNGRVGAGGSYVGRLPSRCRPAGTSYFNVNQGDNSLQLVVSADGKVRRGKGTPSSARLSLAGVTFPVAAAKRSALDLGGAWKAAGAGAAAPSLALTAGGACALAGTVAGRFDPKDRLVASLPPSCRPEATEVFTSADADGLAQRVDVLPDGSVVWMGDAPADGKARAGRLSLDGVLFHAPGAPGSKGSNAQQAAAGKGSAARPHQTKAVYQSGWRDYGESYERAQVTHLGGLCVVSGKAHPGRQDGTILVLPPSCRPRATNVFDQLWHGGATARVNVYADGRVLYQPTRYGGTRTGLALSGVTFAHRSAKVQGLRLDAKFRDVGRQVESAGYVADGDLCALVGVARLASGRLARGQAVTRLPAVCRPDRALFFNANSQDATISVRVAQDGLVTVARATGLSRAANWLSLSGIVFTRRPADYHRVAPGAAWQDAGPASVRLPGYKMHGRVCVVSGAVRPKSAARTKPGSVIATLPDECRPAGRLGFGVNAAFPQTVRVEKDGRIVWLGGRLAGGQSSADKAVDFVSLDGIHFPVA